MTSGVATMTSESSQPSLIFWMYSIPTKSAPAASASRDPLTLGDHQHANRLAGSMREHHRAADHLVGMPGIHAEVDGDVHGLVELGEGGALHQRDGLGDGILAGAVHLGGGRPELLALGRHQSTTSSPMDRAVPAIIFMALSRSDALRSAILISAIFLTWARVTRPTLVRLG